MKTENAPVRVLHVVGGMNRGGAETWLMNMLRRTDQTRIRLDFLVHTSESCAYDEEIRALGSHVIPCLHPHQPFTYAQNFRRIMDEYGPYDVVHSAVHHFSGYVLRLASQCGIGGRIAHSHDASPGDGHAFMRTGYLRLMKHWVNRFATAGLACSTPAAVALFGQEWQSDSRWKLHYPSADLAPFACMVDRSEVRHELGIPDDALVVGHVGRFDPQKNHTYLIEIAAELIRCQKNTRILLVGGGPLREEVETRVRKLGLDRYFVFAGLRSDVPKLMLGAMDCFLLPSLHEGLPLVAVEAQAAGLPLIMSDEITSEALLPTSSALRISLSRSPAVWANAILRMCNVPRVTSAEALAAIANSAFNIERVHGELEKLYGSLSVQQAVHSLSEVA